MPADIDSPMTYQEYARDERLSRALDQIDQHLANYKRPDHVIAHLSPTLVQRYLSGPAPKPRNDAERLRLLHAQQAYQLDEHERQERLDQAQEQFDSLLDQYTTRRPPPVSPYYNIKRY